MTAPNNPKNITSDRMKELLARMKAQAKPSIVTPAIATIADDIADSIASDESQHEFTVTNDPKLTDQITDKHGNVIVYNANQQKFVDLAGSGKSAVLIGAAGTGKTTCQKGAVQKLIFSGKAGILDPGDHRYLRKDTPGIVIVAYTRRAVANIRRNMPTNMQDNCITIHKLLEYAPDKVEYYDEEQDKWKTKMVFEPRRNKDRLLPSSIHTIIYEEGSMLGTDLYEEVREALGHEVQEIFLGDIQQLPPVFGPAILGFKLLELPVVELTEVYRQALESPIIRLAHRILSGRAIEHTEFPEWNVPGKLKLHPWKKQLHWEYALPVACTFFTQAIDNKLYDPEEDIILCPFNKSFGTDELNKAIANHLARKDKAVTYQIISGFKKYYFSVGDKVLYDKEDATIIDIVVNASYSGKEPLPASTELDYWGGMKSTPVVGKEDVDIDVLLATVAGPADGDEEERKNQASHIVKLFMNDSEQEISIQTAGELNLLSLGYALTVHKSQGSEWRKVFLVLHQSHATMIQRELLYTAVTRPKEELYVICEKNTFVNGIRSQRVKGDTLEEKAEFFKGKLKERNGG